MPWCNGFDMMAAFKGLKSFADSDCSTALFPYRQMIDGRYLWQAKGLRPRGVGVC
jgi:hypothetical protein